MSNFAWRRLRENEPVLQPLKQLLNLTLIFCKYPSTLEEHIALFIVALRGSHQF
jgi:hypothetical protein